MGQAIVYCGVCQTQLRGADFEKGAVQFKGQAYCRKCARERIPPEVLDTLLKPAEKPPPPERTPLPTATPRPMPREKPKSSVAPAAIILISVVALAVVVLLTWGGNPPPPPPAVTPVENAAGPVRPPEPRPPRPPPPVDREAVAWDALRKARAFAAENPGDVPGQRSRFEQAVRDARGTSLEGAATSELKAVEEARKGADLAALEAQVRAAAEVEDFPAAVALLEAARPESLDRRLAELREQAARRYAPLREKAIDAQRRGDVAEARGVRDRIAKWGMPALAADLEKALADAAKPPSEAETYRAAWAVAIEPAAGRDYAAAIRGLEQLAPQDSALKAEVAADLKDLRDLRAACEEALQGFLKTPRGQKVALGFFDEAGKPRRVEGSVARADAQRLEIKAGEETIPVLPGELLPESLAARIASKKLASLLRAIEGDPDPDAGIPERFSTLKPDPKREAEARQAFWAAEREFAAYATTVDAMAKFAALLKDYEATSFVRRNRASIQARGEGGREYFFFSDLLKTGGSFKPAKQAKPGACWTSEADGGALKENFVELEFSTLPATEYRCWAYVGGCCGETLAASYQVADAEPAPVPQPLSAAHRRHAAHLGPKEPSRWGWIPLPLPKAAAPGPKRVRLLTDQKGFSVAWAFVSADKTRPPTDAEVREREKARPAPSMSEIREVSDDGLIGRWSFEQGVNDASKNGRHGVAEGGPAPAAGRVGKALRFDGVDDCVRIPATEGLTLPRVREFTVSAWIQRSGDAPGGQPIVHRQRGGWRNDQHSLTLPGGAPALELNTSGGLRSAKGGQVPAQRWVHLAGTFDGTTLRLFVNGAEAASDAGPAGSDLYMEEKPITVGAGINDDSDRPNEYFAGLIDEVRLYYRALTPAEIAALAGR